MVSIGFQTRSSTGRRLAHNTPASLCGIYGSGFPQSRKDGESSMISFEDFLQLSTPEVAALVRATGEKVCVFPVNGTRRWFMLEHAQEIGNDFLAGYMDESIKNHVQLCSMLFDHG